MSTGPAIILLWSLLLTGSCSPTGLTPRHPFTPPESHFSDTLEAQLWNAYIAMGPDYKPRTHHLHSDGKPKYINRLIFETSPYLLQHAHNPVNWRSWGEEAFIEAASADKPILLSVGYSTCHWCHVMERESFEDEEIAAFINQHFIPIKVDREERPDVDEVYMQAVQLLTGRGGWPMTVVMTPEQQPFFGGTYFPARDGDRGTRMGFMTILHRLSAAYEDQKDRVVADAAQVSRRMQTLGHVGRPGDIPKAEVLLQTIAKQKERYDANSGGFGRAPKFPRPSVYTLLLRAARRTQDVHSLRMVTHSLTEMAAGGMYDQIGGGFHRYSTDAQWLVPHFEKMLYDNAQLVSLYVEAWQVTHNPRFKQVANDILAYLMREMRHTKGGYFSATDADSPTPAGHDEEGYFFTWTPEEVRAILDDEADARLVLEWYNIRSPGNFEGRSIPHLTTTWDTFAQSQNADPSALAIRLATLRERLYNHRKTRPSPILDDKILTAWNGLTLSAFAKAGLVFQNGDYLAEAQGIATFLLDKARDADGTLYRTVKDGKRKNAATLTDHAFVIQGLLDVFEATGDGQWLSHARDLQKRQDQQFSDPEGGYFSTANNAEPLLVRMKPDYDGAEPAGNSISLTNLIRLESFTMDEAYLRSAEGLLRAFSTPLTKHGTSLPAMMTGLEAYLDEGFQVVLIQPNDAQSALKDVIAKHHFPNRALISTTVANAPSLKELVPYVDGKATGVDQPRAYVCKKGLCEQPTEEADVLRRQLSKVIPLPTKPKPSPTTDSTKPPH